MSARLGKLAIELHGVYPVRLASKALRAKRAVDHLRCKMDSEVFREHPSGPTRDLATLYFPGDE